MAQIFYKQVKITGDAITLDPVTSSDTVAPDERGFYQIKNAGGVAVDVTIVVPGSLYGQARADIGPVSVAAGDTREFGPLVPDLADPSSGLITINHSVTASVTAAAKRI